jgi:hypothetical protein
MFYSDTQSFLNFLRILNRLEVGVFARVVKLELPCTAYGSRISCLNLAFLHDRCVLNRLQRLLRGEILKNTRYKCLCTAVTFWHDLSFSRIHQFCFQDGSFYLPPRLVVKAANFQKSPRVLSNFLFVRFVIACIGRSHLTFLTKHNMHHTIF